MNVRRAFHVTKALVNAIGSRLRESQHRSVAIFLSSRDDRFQSRKVWHIAGGGQEVKVFLVHVVVARIELGERKWLSGHRWGFVRKYHGFRLNLQTAVLREHVKLRSEERRVGKE